MNLVPRVLRAFIRYVPCLVLWYAQVSPAQHASSSRTDWQQFPAAQDYLKRDRERLLRDLQWNEQTSAPQDSFPVIGRWAWGPCYAVAVKDTFVLIGNGPLLQVLSFSDSAQPRILAEYLTAGLVIDIALRDTLAYVTGTGQLYTFNLSRLPTLELLSQFTLPTIAPTKIQIVDSLLYVLFFSGGLAIIDIRDPHQPVVRSAIAVTEEAAYSLAISGCHAFVGALDSPYLTIVDVCNPDSPFVASTLFTGIVISAHASDTLLYLGAADGTFRVYSIVDPLSPQLRAQLLLSPSQGNYVYSITSDNLIAFASVSGLGIVAIDLSDLNSPVLLDTIRYAVSPTSGIDMSLVGHTLYSAQYIGAWKIDVSTPLNMVHRSFFTTADGCQKIAVREGYAYIASGYTGLWILNVISLDTIRAVANINPGGYAVDVALHDNYAYVLNWPQTNNSSDPNRGLWIIDVSNPHKPAIVSHHVGVVRFSVITNRIAVTDSFAFITQVDFANGGEVELVDITNPAQPLTRSIFRPIGQPYDVLVRGTSLFLATPDSGIRMLSSDNPDSVVEVGHTLALALAVALKDDTLFAVADSGLSILDVSNPADPQFIGATTMPGGRVVADIAIANEFVYMCWNRLYVVDARNRSNPLHVATLEGSSGLFAQGDTVFASGRGIWVLRNPTVTSVVQQEEVGITKDFVLNQNFPNPFNSSTQIRYSILRRKHVDLSVYDVLGRKVATLANGVYERGDYVRVFEGASLSTGFYFLVLHSQDQRSVSKMLLIK